MIYSKSHFVCAAICFLLLSCAASMKTLVLPPQVDSHFRSGEITYPHLFNSNTVEVLEYRVISDSVIESARYDSTVNFGIILPRTSLVIRVGDNKMVFGTGSLQCSVRYKTMNFQTESAEHSILSDIVVNPGKNDPNYDQNRDRIRITPYKKILSGTIQLPQVKKELFFRFEHEKADKNFDSAAIKGYLLSGSDSLFIQPLFKAEMLRGKNVRPMQVLQGYCLMKGDSVYAFLQHAPMIKTLYRSGLKDVLYLNTKTSPEEQLLVAAYFSLVSRLVLTTGTEPLY